MKNNTPQTFFIVDLLTIYTSFFFTYVFYHGGSNIPAHTILLMGYATVIWYFISINTDIIDIQSHTELLTIVKTLLVSYSILSAGIIAAVAIFGNFRPNDKLILYPLLYSIVLSFIFRIAFQIITRYLISRGIPQKSVLIIGGGKIANNIFHQISSMPGLGYKIYGFVADDVHRSLPKKYYLGKIDAFYDIAQSNDVQEVFIALPLKHDQLISSIIKKCELEGIRVRLILDIFRIIKHPVVLDKVGNMPLIGLRPEPLSLLRNRLIKRAFDIFFALFALIIVLPIIYILSLAIKMTSPGPAIFKQKRVGANHIEFNMYKLRSMEIQSRKDSDTLWTTPDDNRITKVGNFLRRTSMDELPQFWNVLIGNMSVVGPRPERGYFVEEFKKKIPNYKIRHLVKSGITGWAQVNGWRGDTSIRKRVEHDIYYLENWSLWFDIKIIYLTVFGRKAKENAY